LYDDHIDSCVSVVISARVGDAGRKCVCEMFKMLICRKVFRLIDHKSCYIPHQTPR